MSDIIGQMLKEEKESKEIARIVTVESLTRNTPFSDLHESHIFPLTVLITIADYFKTPILRLFCDKFLELRKSRNRKDRQEMVDLNQAMSEEDNRVSDRIRAFLRGETI